MERGVLLFREIEFPEKKIPRIKMRLFFFFRSFCGMLGFVWGPNPLSDLMRCECFGHELQR